MNDALVQQLAEDVREIRADVIKIRETLAERRGERRVAVWLTGALGTVAGALAGFVTELYLRTHS